jgi:hypothetical protein
MQVRGRGRHNGRGVAARRGTVLASAALAVSAVGAVGCEPGPSGPQVDTSCALLLVELHPIYVQQIHLQSFPSNETFRYLSVYKTHPPMDNVILNGTVTLDASGSATVDVGSSTYTYDPSAFVGAAVYRDTNGNQAWDPDVDQTIYRGSVTTTSCETTVLNPK